MDIRAAILEEHSKEQVDKIAAWIGRKPDRFAQLVEVFLHSEYRVVQWSAWVLSMSVEKHPELIIPHIDRIVARMHDEGIHVAVKRNVLRILQHIEIPEHLHGEVMNTCFDFLADPKEANAVRVFSMTVLDNLSNIYPEIGQELVSIIEDQFEQGCTPAFRSRGKKILNRKKSKC